MIKQEIAELLNHIEHEKLIEFITEYAAESNIFYEKIKKALLPDSEKESCNIDYYKAKAEKCFDFEDDYYGRKRIYNYYAAAKEAASGLNEILSDADYFVEQGKFADAAAMAMAVAEVVPRNYGNVDDSSGSVAGTFNEAIDLICKQMRTFSDGNELVNQLLEKYRATYKRRRNMMAELRDV